MQTAVAADPLHCEAQNTARAASLPLRKLPGQHGQAPGMASKRWGGYEIVLDKLVCKYVPIADVSGLIRHSFRGTQAWHVRCKHYQAHLAV